MYLMMEFDDVKVETRDASEKTMYGVHAKEQFKLQFGVPMAFVSAFSGVFGDDGIDLSALPPEAVEKLPDPDVAMAWLMWMELKRRTDDVPDGAWEEVIPLIGDSQFGEEDDGEEEQEDPT